MRTFLLLVALILAFSVQAEQRVKLTLFLVPETEACRPDGYMKYNEGSSDCREITREDVEKWKAQGVHSLEYPFASQQTINLGKKLVSFLDTYRTAGRKTPDDGMSLVLFFEWDEAKSGDVEFERKVPTPIKKTVPPMKWVGKMDSDLGWINHQRADAFIPSYGIQWDLKVGDANWEFVFAP
jgi:hypothetical protein